jgi:hypothetical protein
MPRILSLTVLPTLIALYLPFCAQEVRLTLRPVGAPPATLWEEPMDMSGRDVFNGPWGREHAPDSEARYTLVERKHTGVNPGMTVRDPLGREWSVKQAPADDWPAEGPVEVVLSRVLSAVGYLQPPVYYLPAFRLDDDWGTHVEAGGRFRLKHRTLKEVDAWSWQRNPFVGTRPYQGLLVILLMFNSSDLKNSNNSLYEYRGGDGLAHWFVVRDLGTALGSTGRLAPRKNDPDAFARHGFITGIHGGFVEFDYRGWHRELVRRRITPDDVRWAGDLLGRLSDRQWQEAFRAGGYPVATAQRFIHTLQEKIAAAQQAGS